MKTSNYIDIGGISSLLAIQQVCSADSGTACDKVKFTGLSTAGAAGSGWASRRAGSSICAAFGISTGIEGVVCIAAVVGAGAWAGTTVGGDTGEYFGERVYEVKQP